MTAAMVDQAEWAHRGACRDSADPDALFVPGAEQHRAKEICRGCPVRLECGAHALNHRVPHGVWGGTTERQRRQMLLRYPFVGDWLAWLRDRAVRTGVTEPVPEPGECGTDAGYQRHIRRREDACERCKTAHTRSTQDYRSRSSIEQGTCRVCWHTTTVTLTGRVAEHTQRRVRRDRHSRKPRGIVYDSGERCPGSGEPELGRLASQR